mmetsp:Transcript_36514/g.83915  ORF Transcript_36514/g.83915 Transcript_36514/m.83915 type:complete len:206 (+) Transcript_36514:44-661(+)
MCWAFQVVLCAAAALPIACTLFGEWYAIEEGEKCVSCAAVTFFYWKNSTSCTMRTHYSEHHCEQPGWQSYWGPANFCVVKDQAKWLTIVALSVTGVNLIVGIFQSHNYTKWKLFLSLFLTLAGIATEMYALILMANTKPNHEFTWRGAFWAAVFSIPTLVFEFLFLLFLLFLSHSKTYSVLLTLDAPLVRHSDGADEDVSPKRRH